MDVNRVNYQPAPPPPPSPGSGDFAPAAAPPPPAQASAPAPAAAPAPAPAVMDVQAYVQAEARAAQRFAESDTLSRAVSDINTSMAMHARHLSVSFHEATGRRMVTVYDSITNEAIREIPPQQVLDAHASILELAGLFMDTRG